MLGRVERVWMRVVVDADAMTEGFVAGMAGLDLDRRMPDPELPADRLLHLSDEVF